MSTNTDLQLISSRMPNLLDCGGPSIQKWSVSELKVTVLCPEEPNHWPLKKKTSLGNVDYSGSIHRRLFWTQCYFYVGCTSCFAWSGASKLSDVADENCRANKWITIIHFLHRKRVRKLFGRASIEEGEPKQVIHHQNLDNPSWCLVRLMNWLYLSHCPEPRPQLSTWDVWYSSNSVGRNTLGNTVKRLYQDASISGFKTNHSRRVTNATRLFQRGVDEQLIMTRTGHHSVSGVRTHKRVSDDQKETLSSI